MIDCHVHLGKIRYHRDALTKESLLSWMDNNGIDKVCLMATENPEELHYYVTTNEVLSHKSNRFIPFCNVDPRIGGMKYKIIQYYVDRGAMGFGEVIVGLFIDDPRLVEIYKICGDFHLPILIHTAKQFGEDDDNFTRLQNILVKYPQTNFILHSLRWWRDIIVVENMLSKYSNVYGDLSADSGYKFLINLKDTNSFLSTWNYKLIFGTDYLEPGQQCKIIDLIKNANITKEEKDNITENNICRLIKK